MKKMDTSESPLSIYFSQQFFQKFIKSIHLRCTLYISKQISNLLLVLIIRTKVSFIFYIMMIMKSFRIAAKLLIKILIKHILNINYILFFIRRCVVLSLIGTGEEVRNVTWLQPQTTKHYQNIAYGWHNTLKLVESLFQLTVYIVFL